MQLINQIVVPLSCLDIQETPKLNNSRAIPATPSQAIAHHHHPLHLAHHHCH